ncbi:reverse transcriptase domain-containing protein [Artemisia annua]|uniref:Reverse transcriptase domain-containing protein n=1 Tax=Artemisia annua TaxID=35608 RepID=A0A2U1NLF6_ARTAN|nr:reverse transcriptase domain-containing protein [Artemisia annua]
MPVGLGNTEATYNKLIEMAFMKQLGKNLGVHEGYLVTQSKTKEDLLYDFEETFVQLRRINLKPNPRMCSFGIEKERSNEHPPARRRIRAKERITSKVHTERSPGKTHGLKGKLEALREFLSKGVSTNETPRQWSMEAGIAYQRWKDCMEILPTIMALVRGEILLLHVATSFDEVGAMLFAEKRNVQIPVYFVSKILPEEERSYAESEKLVLAMVYATRYLRRYFKDHPIRVLTDKTIEWTFQKPDRSQRKVEWATELEEYNIEYRIEVPFEGHTDEPAEVDETNMSSNKKTLEAKRGEKH